MLRAKTALFREWKHGRLGLMDLMGRLEALQRKAVKPAVLQQ